MAHVKLESVDVRLPVYDASSLRLMRLPWFGRAKIGTGTVTHSGAVFMIHALRNLSVEFTEGDRVCLIGHNGAGKTTLLRLLAGIYPSTGGKVEIDGKVMAVLGTSVALNPDATGYENIQICSRLWGLSPEQIAASLDDIVSFTELGDYLDVPVRTYSTGMMLRLAFAIATVRDPEILLLDEIIGVGDAAMHRSNPGVAHGLEGSPNSR